MSAPTRVILESPYAGNTGVNRAYARAAMLDSLKRGEAPFASHLLYTQVLNDNNDEQREQGLTAARAYIGIVQKMVIYTDLGVSEGMRESLDMAANRRIRIEFRSLPEWKEWHDSQFVNGQASGYHKALSDFRRARAEGKVNQFLEEKVNPFKGEGAGFPGQGMAW